MQTIDQDTIRVMRKKERITSHAKWIARDLFGRFVLLFLAVTNERVNRLTQKFVVHHFIPCSICGCKSHTTRSDGYSTEQIVPTTSYDAAWGKQSGHLVFYRENNRLIWCCSVCEREEFISCSECYHSIDRDAAGSGYEKTSKAVKEESLADKWDFHDVYCIECAKKDGSFKVLAEWGKLPDGYTLPNPIARTLIKITKRHSNKYYV